METQFSMNTVATTLPRLEGMENWSTWKFQMKVFLKAMGLYEVVDGSKVMPQVEQDRSKWIAKDAKAQGVIVSRVTEKVLLHIMSCDNAASMWKKLNAVYEQKSKVSVHLMQQKFFSFKYEGGSISVYLSKLEELINQLKELGEKVSDSMMMTKVLMGLPEEYKHFISAWDSVAEGEQNLNELTARLLIEEERLKRKEVPEEAALSVKVKNEIKCYKCQKPGHYARDCRTGRKFNENVCHYCKRSGHIIKDCRFRLQKESKIKEKKSNAFVATATSVMCALTTSEEWFMDSGATEHMCNNKKFFKELKELQEDKQVIMGDGSLVKVLGEGTVKLQAFDGENWILTVLSNVLFVPDIKVNLFSVTNALDKGYTLDSNNELCRFYKNKEIYAEAHRQGKLYVMNFRAEETKSLVANVASADLKLWHEKLVHQNYKQVKNVLKRNNIHYESNEELCVPCLQGKQHKLPFSSSETVTTCPGEIIHMDLCGPMEEESLGGSRYFLLLKDDYTHYKTVYFLKYKSETIDKIKHYLKFAENEMGNKIKILRSDRGTEFMNKQIQQILSEKGVKHQTSIPYTPEQNGRIEREMRTVVEAARTMLQAKNIEKKLWAEAVSCAVHTLNRTGRSSITDKTPYELWTKKTYNIKYLKVFGTQAQVHIAKQLRKKWDPKSKTGIFIGYGEESKGYRVYFPDSGKVEIHRNIVFVSEVQEKQLIEHKENEVPELIEINEEGKVEHIEQPVEKETHDNEDDQQTVSIEGVEAPDTDSDGQMTEEQRRKGKREIKRPIWLEDYETSFIGMMDEPVTYEEAMKSGNAKEWNEAIDKELCVLKENNTWTEVPIPSDKSVSIIDSKWVFKVKKGMNENPLEFKARLVAKGFQQSGYLNVHDIYAPVAKLGTVRVMFVIANKLKLAVYHMDVKSAFLHGDIDEVTYMRLPNGTQVDENVVCKLNKSIYGLKKSPKCWNVKFDSIMKKEGFSRSQNDFCLYTKCSKDEKLFVLLYVDDLLIFGTDERLVSRLKLMLSKNFCMKDLGLASHYLGINIKQDLVRGVTELSQSEYLQSVLNKFEMTECKPMSTPMDSNFNFNLLKGNVDPQVENMCRKIIGSLMYAVLCTRPDLCASVTFLSRYQTVANNDLLTALKRVLRYVKETIDLKLVYKCGDLYTVLCGYVDADWGGDPQDRKSTTGFVFSMFNCPISWCSKKQHSVAISSSEAEYVALSMAVSEACFLCKLIDDFKMFKSFKPVTIFEDNIAALRIAKNPESNRRLKHIDIKHHFIKQKIDEKIVDIIYVKTENQIADIFTKPLVKDKFIKFRKELQLQFS